MALWFWRSWELSRRTQDLLFKLFWVVLATLRPWNGLRWTTIEMYKRDGRMELTSFKYWGLYSRYDLIVLQSQWIDIVNFIVLWVLSSPTTRDKERSNFFCWTFSKFFSSKIRFRWNILRMFHQQARQRGCRQLTQANLSNQQLHRTASNVLSAELACGRPTLLPPNSPPQCSGPPDTSLALSNCL